MIDEARSFVEAAEELHERGAYKIYVLATHGILSGDSPQQLAKSRIDEVRRKGGREGRKVGWVGWWMDE